jgi:hypothetical protein
MLATIGAFMDLSSSSIQRNFLMNVGWTLVHCNELLWKQNLCVYVVHTGWAVKEYSEFF